MFFGKKTDANTSSLKTLSLISSTFKMASEEWKKLNNLKMKLGRSCQSNWLSQFHKLLCWKISNVQLFSNFLKMEEFLKDIVAAYRKSDWKVLLHVLQNILQIFRDFDSISYLQYELYLENMPCQLMLVI